MPDLIEFPLDQALEDLDLDTPELHALYRAIDGKPNPEKKRTIVEAALAGEISLAEATAIVRGLGLEDA